jgi:hypothetical protein
MEVDISSQACRAGKFASAIVTGRLARMACGSLVRIGSSRAANHTIVVIEIRSNAIEAISTIDATSTVG